MRHTPERRRSFWHLMFMVLIWTPLTLWIASGHLGRGRLYRAFSPATWSQVTLADVLIVFGWVLAGLVISAVLARIVIKGK